MPGGSLAAGADGQTASPPDRRIQRTALWALLGAKVLAAWGVQWDIRWHVTIGRDSFWIAPHVMTYAGVAAVVLLSFGVLALATWRGGGSAPVRLLGLAGPRGFQLAAWGIAMTVLAAPIDDLWHRLFGIDVTLWSPPHLLGIAGSAVNGAACLAIAREAYPAGSRRGAAALMVSGGLLYANLHLVLDPSNLVAFRQGGVLFYTLAMLSAALLPLALVASALLSGDRWAPVWVVAVTILVSHTGHLVADAGFAWLRPVPVIEEEIRKAPDSPIATAWAIADRNGTPAGKTGGLVHVVALGPALVLALLDVRRRPRVAAAGWALALFAALHLLLASRAAFAPLVPPWPLAAAALAVTLAAALASARSAAWLAAALAEEAPTRALGGARLAAVVPVPARDR